MNRAATSLRQFDFVREVSSRVRSLVERQDSRNPVRLVSITGIGAIGKTSTAKCVSTLWPTLCVNVLEFDRFIQPREQRIARGYSGINIAAYDAQGFLRTLRRNLSGFEALVPFYDHLMGNSCQSCSSLEHNHVLPPSDKLIVVGVPHHIDFFQDISPDLLVFLEFVDLRSARSMRILRDTTERGVSRDIAARQFEKLEADYHDFLAPTRDLADFVVSVSDEFSVSISSNRKREGAT